MTSSSQTTALMSVAVALALTITLLCIPTPEFLDAVNEVNAADSGNDDVPAVVPVSTADDADCQEDPAPKAGTVRGGFVYNGPPLQPRVVARIPLAPGTPAQTQILDESLVVNPGNKGLANVIVYMSSKPEGAEFRPALREKPVLQVKDSMYEPRCLVVQVAQELTVRHADQKTQHNPFMLPLRNRTSHRLLAINGEYTVQFRNPELIPIEVKCAIHAWMKAWLLVLDHPFAAVTDENGSFHIAGVPYGTHVFIFWHETCGYFEIRRIEVSTKNVDLKTIRTDLKR